jgi:hypothetical protein
MFEQLIQDLYKKQTLVTPLEVSPQLKGTSSLTLKNTTKTDGRESQHKSYEIPRENLKTLNPEN